jgi:opacity protein-like surface antigen
MRLLFVVTLCLSLAPSGARAADGALRRFAVVAGASLGGPGRTPLRYAASDARDVSRVLRRLGGVAMDDLVLLEEPDAERIRAALAGVAAEAERARQAGRRVEVFVYYSGHSDEDGLLLGTSRLPYAELRRELDQVPADVRVAILDSCASGAFTRAKGGEHRPPFLLDEASRVRGHAFLTSSAAHEAAQESDRLKASFFTHALLTGLRGAADSTGDRVVTLNEAYQFAFRETLAGTETTQAGPQHATYDIGLVGSGDVVMTDLRVADALLVLPEALDGRVFVRNGSGQLVAELRKVRGTRIDLALEEGRYEVRVAREQRVAAALVSLPPNARTVLDETKLYDVPLEATAARGDGGLETTASAAGAGPPPTRDRSAPTKWSAVAVRGGPAISMRSSSQTGFQFEVAAEAWHAGVLGIEASSGWGRISGATTGDLPWGPGHFQGDVYDEVTTVPALLTVKLCLPTRLVQPYLLGGAGLYFVRVERRAARAYSWLVPGADRFWDEDTFGSFHAGAGVRVRFSTRASASVEARYSSGKANVVHEHMAMETLRVSAGVGYWF